MSHFLSNQPSMTVVIPVYNGGKFLRASIESCTNQETSFPFKILVLDDGSKDNSAAIAEEYSDKYPFVQLERCQKRGLVDTLNRSLTIVTTDFIARHDADDIMHRDRLQVQFDYLSKTPNNICLGGQLEIFGEDLRSPLPKSNSYPLTDREIRAAFPKGNPFASPTVTFCRKCALAVGGYRRLFDGAEDYDLWIRLSTRGHIANLPHTLTFYRKHDAQVTSSQIFKVYRATFLTKVFAMFNFKYYKKNQAVYLDSHTDFKHSNMNVYIYMFFLLSDLFKLLRYVLKSITRFKR
jgi:glycosyltransferase involved in cell wall biosynthesis